MVLLRKKKLQALDFIMTFLQPFYWQVIGIMLVACYWAIHISLQPYIIKVILDRVSQDPTITNVIIPALFYCILSIVSVLNFRFYDYVCLLFYPKLKANIISQVTTLVSNYSYGFFQERLSGSLANKINDLSHGAAEIIRILVDRFFSHILALFVACLTLVTVHPALAIIFVGWTITLVVVSFIATKKARLLSHEFSETNSHVVGTIVDRFTNILSVRLFTALYHEAIILEQNLNEMVQRDKNLQWYLLKVMTIQGIVTVAMISGCVLVLIFSLHSRHITIGDFGLVLTLTLTFADIIWRFAQEISNFSGMYGLVSQGLTLLNQEDQIQEIEINKDLNVEKGEIQFQKVCFQYPNADPLFINESITIDAGQKIGLVGYSGSGKTTFLNLILRLFDVTSGHILIDGQDISQVTQDSLYRSIAMISENPTLFHRTLMDNIRYGQIEASDDEVIQVAKKVFAHEFIMSFPERYDTCAGEKGVKLSSGQKQRIAIARAILKNAPILLFDEATSALDSVTETYINNSLLKVMQNKTTIVIAHRLSTLLQMDRILVFNKGKIVEDGSHDELLKRDGLYKSLWDAQVSGFIIDQGNRLIDAKISEKI